jgi:hypothetical protein
MISQGLDDLFRGLQRAEIDIQGRDHALRLAFEFWRVAKEVMTHGPNRELLRKLNDAERAFLNALDVLNMGAENRPTIERIEA